MAKVVDIERVRVDRLADELLPLVRDAFAGPGMLKVSTDDIEDVERWRRAARACARRLGVSCSTSVSADRTFVWIVDESPPSIIQRAHSPRAINDLFM
ncbi:MAG: hypothetical protein EDR02_14475 [Actinobacteria bacterium]|nr:MAG: hypothetical protein EDR02_14475 [Actinomycetota bacterium]RIK06320.1 MAG: hypothetical protein DCC48_07805 [Acidobacteriota bacterium]